MSMNEDEERAMSDPEPIAMLRSAVERAGASFMPSPTMATVARFCLLIFCSFKFLFRDRDGI